MYLLRSTTYLIRNIPHRIFVNPVYRYFQEKARAQTTVGSCGLPSGISVPDSATFTIYIVCQYIIYNTCSLIFYSATPYCCCSIISANNDQFFAPTENQTQFQIYFICNKRLLSAVKTNQSLIPVTLPDSLTLPRLTQRIGS